MSTEFTGRNSSRVLRPPGGGCSNIFGTAEEQKPRESGLSNENRPPAQPVSTTVPEKNTADDIEGDVEKDDNDDSGSQTAAAGPEQDANCCNVIVQKGRTGGSGYNPITGEPFDKAGQVSDESKKQNIRVRQPPGGASTKLW